MSIGLASALCLAACGGSGEGTEPTETTETSGSETTGAEGGSEGGTVAWADMDQEQRAAFMSEVVVPEMRPLFQEVDAERYAEFGCRTCHGENARDVSFEMPNGVAPLQHSQIGAIFQSEEPMAQMMTQRVWPRMAELLGEPQFDPQTGEGFSCFDCHATAEGE
ncbi:MAG: hypothetical protein R3B82_01955 [Sandaracinaceae bacterium]